MDDKKRWYKIEKMTFARYNTETGEYEPVEVPPDAPLFFTPPAGETISEETDVTFDSFGEISITMESRSFVGWLGWFIRGWWRRFSRN